MAPEPYFLAAMHNASRLRIIVYGFLLSVASCKAQLSNIEVAYQRGLSENVAREKFGLRKIETTWICFRSLDGTDEWITDRHSNGAAVKIVKHDMTGALVWEEDRYWSEKLVKIDDAEVQEEIGLIVDYASGRLKVNYIGNDRQIKHWIQELEPSNNGCIEIIARVSEKWLKRK